MVAAIDNGYPQREIADAAYRFQQQIDKKKRTVVGVNKFITDHPPVNTLKIDPEVKVVVMTGYAVDDHVTQALERGAKGVLNKPFRAEEIGKMIRRILDEKPISTQAISHKRGSGLRVVSSK